MDDSRQLPPCWLMAVASCSTRPGRSSPMTVRTMEWGAMLIMVVFRQSGEMSWILRASLRYRRALSTVSIRMVGREAEISEDNSDFTHTRLHRTGGLCLLTRLQNNARVDYVSALSVKQTYVGAATYAFFSPRAKDCLPCYTMPRTQGVAAVGFRQSWLCEVVVWKRHTGRRKDSSACLHTVTQALQRNNRRVLGADIEWARCFSVPPLTMYGPPWPIAMMGLLSPQPTVAGFFLPDFLIAICGAHNYLGIWVLHAFHGKTILTSLGFMGSCGASVFGFAPTGGGFRLAFRFRDERGASFRRAADPSRYAAYDARFHWRDTL